MKIVILAAGRGQRLMPLTQNTPKPLLDMGNGKTLLEEQMISIQKSGVIDEVILIVGYLNDQIEAKMRLYHDKGFAIRTLYNPFWQVSNNLLSLWLARQVIAEHDVIITNGDNIFTPKTFTDLASQADGIWLAVCPKDQLGPEDMKVKLVDGFVSSVSKTMSTENITLETPGLAMAKGGRARQLFVEHLEGVVRDNQDSNRFWLEVFNRMWNKGVLINPWEFSAKGNWQEIDFHGDLKLMQKLLNEKVMNLATEKEN